MKKILFLTLLSLSGLMASAQHERPETKVAVCAPTDHSCFHYLLSGHRHSDALDASGYASFIERALAVSPETKALEAELEAELREARVGIGPENPEAEIAAFVNRNTSFEMNVSQGFDFPTVYVNRGRIARLSAAGSRAAHSAAMRRLAGEAQVMYIDAIYHNNMVALLELSLKNADHLVEIFARQLESGDASALETNKVEILRLDASTRYRKAIVERDNNLRAMRRMASLPEDFEVADTLYPLFDIGDTDDFVARASQLDYDMQGAAIDTLIAERQVRLARSEWAPGFKVGYRLNMDAKEPSHAVLAGITIPLWGRVGTMRAAKASREAARRNTDALRSDIITGLESVKASYLSSLETLEQYRGLLRRSNTVELLNKALEAGHISMLEYLSGLDIWLSTVESIIENEHDAALAAATMQLCLTEF